MITGKQDNIKDTFKAHQSILLHYVKRTFYNSKVCRQLRPRFHNTQNDLAIHTAVHNFHTCTSDYFLRSALLKILTIRSTPLLIEVDIMNGQ